MKFVLTSNNVKIFAKSILSLSKIGDEIYIEPLQDSLTLRTVNSSRSAFTCFTFKRGFFSFFEPDLVSKNCLNTTSNRHENTTLNDSRALVNNDDITILDDNEKFKCKIPAKSLLSIFKNVNSLEKNVEKCTITVKYIPLNREVATDYDQTMITRKRNKNNEEQLYDTKFLIIMNCKFGLRKTFILSISDCENLQAAFSTEKCTNKLNIGAKYLHETMNSFANDTEEVTFFVEANKLIIRNYVEPDTTDPKSLISTQVNFDSDEFNSYEIEKEMDITFCLKEFKVCLAFGQWFDLTLDCCFQKKGRPIIFTYTGNVLYDVNFTLATLDDDGMTSQNSSVQQSLSSHSIRARDVNVSMANNASIRYNQNENTLCESTDKQMSSARRSKGNKRTLFDASNVNEVYLNDESSREDQHHNEKQQPNNQDDDDDDVLLSQYVNTEKEKLDSMMAASSMSNKTIGNTSTANSTVVITSKPTTSLAANSNRKEATPPPSKKLKSLVQAIFVDDDSDEDEESRNEETQTTGLRAGSNPILLASFLKNSSTSTSSSSSSRTRRIEHEQQRDKQHHSIYVEDTDDEE